MAEHPCEIRGNMVQRIAKDRDLFKVRCPWCDQWPVIGTHDQGRYWAICVTPACPVNPVTNATDTPASAAELWNLCRR